MTCMLILMIDLSQADLRLALNLTIPYWGRKHLSNLELLRCQARDVHRLAQNLKGDVHFFDNHEGDVLYT
ncbi:hypothetical protein HID58_032232 [Brassica napus]|uniref:Uncharacterized protein n=1 Tax=Brassica napus TaxID=3708 RepID=A0ABQ8BVS6_BRANA|nr:hypothetical protein HID58_032232 [Brassica napus]